MIKKILLVSCCSLLLVASSFGAKTPTPLPDQYKDFAIDGETIHAFVPSGWQVIKDGLGIPLTLVSKKGSQDQRSVIEVVPTGINESKVDLSKLKKDPEAFFEQKEAWLGKVNGRSISYQPLKEVKKDGATIYSIGIKYKSAQGNFLDKTYYISTKSKQVYSIKTLIPLDLEKDQEVAVNTVINTISAQN